MLHRLLIAAAATALAACDPSEAPMPLPLGASAPPPDLRAIWGEARRFEIDMDTALGRLAASGFVERAGRDVILLRSEPREPAARLPRFGQHDGHDFLTDAAPLIAVINADFEDQQLGR